MNTEPYLKLNNGEVLRVGEVKKTIQGELTIQQFSYGFDLASRTSIINHLIKKYNLNSYLEIGVRDGRNYEKIIAKNKTGVDPYPIKEIDGLYKLTSDDFFKINKTKFDLIFIDGLHLEQQVDKDIKGCLNILSKNGFIIMHDCNPPTEFHQRENYEVDGKFPPWNGTVWKSFAKLRIKMVDLDMSCVDCDWGVGIIRKKKQLNFKHSGGLDFEFLDRNRIELLNLISVNSFIKKY
jgi:hypothetical protein